MGDVTQDVQAESTDEIGKLLGALGKMTLAERDAAQIAERLAGGDLAVTVTPRSDKDMMLNAMAEMVDRLTEVVGEVQTGAVNVSSGSEQLSAAAETLSQGSSEQARPRWRSPRPRWSRWPPASGQNADNARQTEAIALKSAQDARESGEAVNKAVDAMKQIAGKISIIEEIARQTDLLALNAAVEAARAGDHGKGFAVVASEVRKLAERSQAAASEITELSRNTTAAAERAGGLLIMLVPNIQKTADLVQEINAASQEQSNGAGQVNQALQQLDQVIQANAAAAEELASTSEELSAQAVQLQSSISFFRLERASLPTAQAKPKKKAAPAKRAPVRPTQVAARGKAGARCESVPGLRRRRRRQAVRAVLTPRAKAFQPGRTGAWRKWILRSGSILRKPRNCSTCWSIPCWPWRKTPRTWSGVDACFRAMHTIKGGGAMFGFDEISRFTHDVETVFDLVRFRPGARVQGSAHADPQRPGPPAGAHPDPPGKHGSRAGRGFGPTHPPVQGLSPRGPGAGAPGQGRVAGA